jgi:hypothetical protein
MSWAVRINVAEIQLRIEVRGAYRATPLHGSSPYRMLYYHAFDSHSTIRRRRLTLCLQSVSLASWMPTFTNNLHCSLDSLTSGTAKAFLLRGNATTGWVSTFLCVSHWLSFPVYHYGMRCEIGEIGRGVASAASAITPPANPVPSKSSPKGRSTGDVPDPRKPEEAGAHALSSDTLRVCPALRLNNNCSTPSKRSPKRNESMLPVSLTGA